MERREFLKTGCSLCMAVSMGLIAGSLSSCTPVYMASISENKITVPVSLFDKTDLQIIRIKHFEYDVALIKNPADGYTSLLLRCTHADNPLKNTGNGFVCDLHGSTFDKSGAVTKGPAEFSLKKLFTEKISDQIIIYMNPG